MKNFKYYLFTLVCMIAVSSCSLDETSYMEIEKKDYMNNASEAEKVLLGVPGHGSGWNVWLSSVVVFHSSQ